LRDPQTLRITASSLELEPRKAAGVTHKHGKLDQLFLAEWQMQDTGRLSQTCACQPAKYLAVPKALGDVIREFRERANVSQTALARAAGVDPAILSRIEAGSRTSMQIATLCRIAEALEVSLDELAGAAGLMRSKPKGSPTVGGRLRGNEDLSNVQRLLKRASDQIEALKRAPEPKPGRRRKP